MKPSQRTRIANFKLTPEQYKMVQQRAERCGVRMGFWMRSIILQVATSKAMKPGYMRVREPSGETT